MEAQCFFPIRLSLGFVCEQSLKKQRYYYVGPSDNVLVSFAAKLKFQQSKLENEDQQIFNESPELKGKV